MMSAARPAKYRECASRISDASPRATSCCSANWRIVSSIENRVRPEILSATSSDLRTSASSRSKIANSTPEPVRSELLLGELADRLQHRKPGPPRNPVSDQQRLAHQRVEQIQDSELITGTRPI